MSVIEYPPKPIHKLKRQQLETVCIALEGMRDEAIRQRDDARAKLAAAEQERDRLNGQLDAVRSADREIIWRQAAELAQMRSALAPVRELVEREKRERGGRATPWTFVAELEAALATAEQPEPNLPDNWFFRTGHYEDGQAFAYCAAEGPARAHCCEPQGHGGDHRWGWFTREQRARAEQPEPEAE